MDLIGFLYGVGIFQGLMLAIILLLAPSDHRMPNALMAALVTAIALDLLNSWLTRAGFYLESPTGWTLIPAMSFTWGPLLFLYAYSLTNRTVSWKQSLHFLPALALMVASFLSFQSFSIEDQKTILDYFWSPRNDPQLLTQMGESVAPFWRVWIDWHLQGIFFALHLGTYCFLVLHQIRSHNRGLKQHFSSLEHMNLRWLRTLTVICLVYLLLYMVFNRTHVILTGYFDVNALAPSAPYIFLVMLLYIIGIAAIFQSSLIRGVEAIQGAKLNSPEEAIDWVDTSLSVKRINPEQPIQAKAHVSSHINGGQKSEKYLRSGLNPEDAARYMEVLTRKMVDEKYYLDCDLTLPELAKFCGMTPHQVSQVINEQMKKSFFSFISDYRIQLAKELLATPETANMPIVELALEVGFKSKSSFYNAFKKSTQMTPSQFKKNKSMARNT